MAAAWRRHRTAVMVCCFQNPEFSVPEALSEHRAAARSMAVWGCSQPRTGDHRSDERMPDASPCGSKTATGPMASRVRRVAVRLSGRVEVVTTAPGAERIAGMTRW